MFRKALLATAATVLFSIPAMAADVVVEAPVVVSSWTGFYFGGGIGAAWSDFDTKGKFCYEGFESNPDYCYYNNDLEAFGSLFGSDDDTAFRGIVQAGFDWEMAPGFVIGAMGDFNFGQETGASFKSNDAFWLEDDEYNKASYKVNNMWTLSGRLGYGTEQALFYGLIGYTWADTEASFATGCFEGDCWFKAKNDDTVNGPTFGGGVEFKGLFWDTASTRLEYRYTDLDSVSVSGRDLNGDFWQAKVDQNVQGIYLTVNWRFDAM